MKRSLIILFTIITCPLIMQSQTVLYYADSVSTGYNIIEGKVTDKSGEPVIGASVKQKDNSDRYTITDADGVFTLSGLPESCVLQISYIGYMPQEIKVSNDKRRYPVVLDDDCSILEEIVVVGYATQKKVDLTGAVSSISAGALDNRPIANATNALVGLAAGLTVTNSGGNTPGYESQSILVRGLGTLNNAAPLVVVDGMTGIALSDINPQTYS